jgi:hypothetical protein
MTSVRKVTTDKFRQHHVKELRAKGFRKIGSGAFATVYGHKSNKKYVYKVGVLEDTPQNDAYLCYVKKAIQHKLKTGNPWLPQIKELVIYKHTAAANEETDLWGYYVVKLERLNPIGKKGDEIVDTVEASLDLIRRKKKRASNITNDVFDNHYINAIKLIVACIHQGHCQDVHEGNFMKRKNGEVVITDPVS